MKILASATLAFLAMSGAGMSAQQTVMNEGPGEPSRLPASAFGTGTVTGHVICADSQRVARFATIAVVPKPAHAVPSSRSAALSEAASLQMVQAKTGMDGSFVFHALPAGDYYVVATMAGYVLPFADDVKQDENGSVDVSKMLANFPLVHVEPARTSSIDVSMQRGAVISGRITFEDGSPAASMEVIVKPVGGKTIRQLPMMGFELARGLDNQPDRPKTDDDGRYRISGLQSGKYIVSVSLRRGPTMRTGGTSFSRFGTPDTGSELWPTVVYAPGSFHQSAAVPIEVQAGDVRSDADVQIKLSGLHQVQGRVLALSDRHPIGETMISIRADDGFDMMTQAGTDGAFHFELVPEGSYTLSVQAYDLKPYTNRMEEPEILRAYQLKEQPLLVAAQDVIMDEILLPDRKTDAKHMSEDPQ